MNARSREVWAVVGLLAIVATLVILLRSGAPERSVDGNHPVHTDSETGEKYILVGGVRRPATDLAAAPSAVRPDVTQPSADTALFQRIGRTQPVQKTANPMTRSVAEALDNGTHPERLSVLIDPAPFDNDAYRQNPQAYLNVVEPGRVWQSAQPGPNVPRISALTPRLTNTAQDETVSLKAKVTPGAPVTFTSLDLGRFQNQLTSISVQADDEGVAVARFTGTSGTVHDVHILAASPVTSGQLHFIVHVELPPEPQAVTATPRESR